MRLKLTEGLFFLYNQKAREPLRTRGAERAEIRRKNGGKA
ncbi:hypothetical protein SABR111722_19855 [Saccharibacillus brassicae]